jgi:shikimate kinase
MYTLTQPLILCGFMASGKTATAKAMGKILQSGFVDLDVQIEAEVGKSIPQIFKDHGEDYFRRIERRTVIKVINEAPKIISLGGGALQNQELLDKVKAHAILIFIRPDFEQIFKRLINSRKRPLIAREWAESINTDIAKERIKNVYLTRLPLYEQAHITQKVESNWSSFQVARKILDQVSQFQSL